MENYLFIRQISLSAFEYLFSKFSSSFPSTTDKFKGHCILACDGCHVVYATNSDIIEDYNKPQLIDYKGYNHMHLNGFVDVISKAFLDVVIQPGQQPDEREALHSMLDHFTPDDSQKYIITADRGYESYDLLFHCELKNLGYVFRVKSPSSPKSILSYYASELPDDLEEFDVTIKRFFTDKATNKIYSRLILYNFCIFIANEAAEENRKKKRDGSNKYLYELDFCIKNCQKVLHAQGFRQAHRYYPADDEICPRSERQVPAVSTASPWNQRNSFWISVSSATEYPFFWQMDNICLFGIPVFGFWGSKYRIFDNN